MLKNFTYLVFFFCISLTLSRAQVDSKQKAREMIKALHESEIYRSAYPVKGNLNWHKKAFIQLQFPYEAISGILKNGFLNYHQTKTTHGTKNRKKRLEAENQMARGTGFEYKLDNEMRPKSAFLMLPDGDQGYLGPEAYGEVSAIFKNEVKNRSTWTAGDSLGEAHGQFTVRPSAYTFYYPLEESPHAQTYLEAQIWGKLDLHDVAEFWVRKDIPINQLNLLKKAGLPIYYYRIYQYKSGQRAYNKKRLRGSRIYAGDKCKKHFLN